MYSNTAPLIHCQSLSKSYGTRRLFQDICLSIFLGDRVGLIGPNGSGKTTLLQILAGQEVADQGSVVAQRGLRIGYVEQMRAFSDMLPRDVLCRALADRQDIPEYERDVLVERMLDTIGLSGEDCVLASHLSGGWQKRLAIGEAIIASPDLLLLDEPTNHLDVDGILWLEQLLTGTSLSYLLISHDRFFLQHVVDRVVEINSIFPMGLFAVEGNYAQFLQKKEEFLAGQLRQERSLSSKARRESDWLKRTPKARTTKSRSRIEEAEELFATLSQVQKRNAPMRLAIEFATSSRETQKLVVVKNLCKHQGGKVLFQKLDFTLSPGRRIGLLGPNGAGKTTLLRMLTDEVIPDRGTIKRADGLKIVYFDQHRTQLPEDLSLRAALSPSGDFVIYHGKSLHVHGWCRRFLFSPDLLDIPLSKLSGGERARVAIAHLMLQPADVLLLDEPTNDLDIPTLEALEESLLEFPGAIVLITHDRAMLHRVCTGFLGLGHPETISFFTDYAQWETHRHALKQGPVLVEQISSSPVAEGRLRYLAQKEYAQIQRKLAALEQQVREQHCLLNDPQLATDPQKLEEICTVIAEKETQIEQLYLRWEQLEHKDRHC